jgi:hypothetical protein
VAIRENEVAMTKGAEDANESAIMSTADAGEGE